MSNNANAHNHTDHTTNAKVSSDRALADVHTALVELTKRLCRVETRLVVLAHALGHGDKFVQIPNQTTSIR